MPTAVSPNPRAGSAQPDDLDRLLDYDNAVDDFLRDIPVNNDAQNNNAGTTEPARDEDQEVQVKKKRNPVPKLDENRLLSDAGIPKLRKITKTRLKFRGKGHEFTDISRLLNTYQLWLDDLYPKAKFRDALTMVEKVGHSKRMQVMRKAWLDDTKPYRKESTPDVEMSGANGDADRSREEREASLFGEAPDEEPGNGNSTEKTGNDDAPDDDELDAMLAENRGKGLEQAQKPRPKQRGPFEEDDTDDEDELDALMAENAGLGTGSNQPQAAQKPLAAQEPDEDELDALMTQQSESNPKQAAPSANVPGTHSQQDDRMDDFADEEEAMASMGGMW